MSGDGGQETRVIDFHVHLMDRSWLPGKWWRWLERRDASRGTGLKGVLAKGRPRGVERFFDPEGRKLLDAMDQGGIHRSVVLPLDYGLLLGEPETSIREQNRRIAEIALRHPSRIVAFAGVDPRRPEAEAIVEEGICQLGMKGVKLHPGAGFDPGDDGFRPLMERIAELGVPLLIHTGSAFGPLRSRWCRPLDLDVLLSRYADLRIVAAHMGGGWLDELCWTGYMKPQLYGDVSLWQMRCRQAPREFGASLRKALDMLGMERVLFGTDWPFTADVMSPGKYADAVRGLSESSGVRFLSAEIKAILGRNGARLLGIE